MDGLSIALQRLDAARTKDELVGALWDLRDSAYDTPEVWSAFAAEAFFQRLAGELEDAPADDGGQISVPVFARAVKVAVAKPGYGIDA
ncbi:MULTISPECIES: hypothetical protein [unclassified Oerskovia]|uniref:hypothetical protein n=1 Tax=unclassified Oerskovia TaxID=2619021 RepID=UPI003015D82F